MHLAYAVLELRKVKDALFTVDAHRTDGSKSENQLSCGQQLQYYSTNALELQSTVGSAAKQKEFISQGTQQLSIALSAAVQVQNGRSFFEKRVCVDSLVSKQQ
eukprot:6200946-Pleurochrysis_carterae.AAC.1